MAVSVIGQINNDVGTYWVSIMGGVYNGVIRWIYNFSRKNIAYRVSVIEVEVSGVGNIDPTKISVQWNTGYVMFYSTDATVKTYDNRPVNLKIQVTYPVP